MLVVKTFLEKSFIHGIGLFAAEDIPANTIVWTLSDKWDVIFDEIQHPNQLFCDFLTKFSYKDVFTSKFVLCLDDARFINHSKTPNLKPIPYGIHAYGADIALTDIKQGEELTIDYEAIHET